MKYRCDKCSNGRVKTHAFPDGAYKTGACPHCNGTGFEGGREMKELNTSSTDAMQWAACLAERINSGVTPDADFLVGWFANYWAAVHDPLKAALEAAESREAELRKRLAQADGPGIVLELAELRLALDADHQNASADTVERAADCIQELRARVAELEGMVPSEEKARMAFFGCYPEGDSTQCSIWMTAFRWSRAMRSRALPAAPKEEV